MGNILQSVWKELQKFIIPNDVTWSVVTRHAVTDKGSANSL